MCTQDSDSKYECENATIQVQTKFILIKWCPTIKHKRSLLLYNIVVHVMKLNSHPPFHSAGREYISLSVNEESMQYNTTGNNNTNKVLNLSLNFNLILQLNFVPF